MALKERHVDEILHCFILECQRGFYKDSVGNAKCVPCPANSASNTVRAGCTCKEGYSRSSNMADCEGIHIYIYIYIYISVWSFPNHYRFIRVLRPKEDHFGFVYENSKCSKEQKALQCYVLLNA